LTAIQMLHDPLNASGTDDHPTTAAIQHGDDVAIGVVGFAYTPVPARDGDRFGGLGLYGVASLHLIERHHGLE
jgi:hypothetical protein